VDKITYAFIPGPFLRVLSKALINANSDGEKKPYVLLIEEINRANVASVFGEVFQLLDREDDGKNAEFLNASKYSISPSEDVKKYLVDEFKKAGLETTVGAFSDIRIPDNMFIWASMNSADQGVFPMDTAFKRRWEFEYFGINKSEEKIKEYFFKVNEEVINWNALRKAINYRLTSLKINEDKLMGPFFMSSKVLNACTYDHSIVIKAIQNKVIMYLFEDAGRQKRKDIFVNGYEKTYSEICADFEVKGLGIFAKEIVDKYNEIKQ
jgi:5-methylcytosine-specific restriction endonuclease McrBC GTP-binding regulatory subunit McrB